jgi:ubiquinone/menaquinone biosynthesis C-methylase UbiE
MKRPARVWWALIRFGFRLLYNELAWTYDLVSWTVSLGKWRQWQRAAIPHLQASPQSLILELAHGTGDLQIDLAAAGLCSVALDLSRSMGRIARRKLRRAGFPPRLVRASGLNLPFPAGCFDAIVSTFPTEFIIDSRALREIRRVLKPGGRFVVVINGLLTPDAPVERVLEWLYRITGQRGPWPGDPLVNLRAAGLDGQIITEEMPGSSVLMVVATRA